MKVNSGKDVAEEYTSSLADLTLNSKPLINMLTMLAEDYIEHAPLIVKVVELHLQKVACDIKLPVLYLIDSIVKNVGKTYVQLFTQNIVSTFCAVFEKVDEKVRSQMFKLRQTWNEVFPAKKLYALDVRVHAIDPAWPITANPPQSVQIHVNPKFLQAHATATGSSTLQQTTGESPVPINDGIMREELLKQQKELLELQKRKVELELMQTKAILEEQQKKLENQAAIFISDSVVGHSSNTMAVNAKPKQENVSPNQYSNEGPTADQPAPHIQPTVTRIKPYKSGESTFNTRDPRIKFNKDKNSEFRIKAHSSLKDSNQSLKHDGKPRKEKKNFKKHKYRYNPNKTELDRNIWKVVSPPHIIGCQKKPVDRYDKDLLTKLPSEEPPPPGVDIITIVEDDESGKNGHQSASSLILESPVTVISPPVTPPPSTLPINLENNNRNIDDTNEGCQSGRSSSSNLTQGSGSGGIKRCHSRTPSPSQQQPNDDKESDENGIQPPKKKLSSVDPPFSPGSNFGPCTDEVVINNTSKDIDLRLLPSPTKSMSEDSQMNVPVKKTRAEILDKLFGDEDVDLRTFPHLVPSPQQSVTSRNELSPTEESCLIRTNSPPRILGSHISSLFSSELPQKLISPDTSSQDNATSTSIFISPTSYSNIGITIPNTDLSLSVNDFVNPPRPSSVNSSNSPHPSESPRLESPADNDTYQNNAQHNTILSSPPSGSIPSPPPPPIISKEDVAEESSWANYKKTKSEEYGCRTPSDRENKGRKDRTPNAFFRSEGLLDEIKETEQESEERSSAKCNLIIKEAEHQLSTGNITFSQYNRMLKEVIAINEERKLQEALRKDESFEEMADSKNDIEEEDENMCSRLYEKKLEEETHLNDILPSQESIRNMSDRSEVDDDSTGPENSSGKKEKFHSIKDRSRRTYFPVEGKNRACNNSRVYSERAPLHPPVWPGRGPGLPMLPRPPWFGRLRQPFNPGPPSNPPLFPLWMLQPAPSSGPNQVFYGNNNAPKNRFGYAVPPINKQYPPIVRHQPLRRQDVPPADPHVLELIEKDTMRLIKIDRVIREVRFYGEIGIIMLAWDDPREIKFQAGSRRLIVDENDHFLLHFNAPYRDCIIDNHLYKIRLGAPTRELFVDGVYYEMIFGGPPVQIILGGRPRMVQLTGPMPKVRIGSTARTDLVAGKINLIIDAKMMFPIFLDAKPQRFEIGGVPYILRFVEALQTVVINGIPFKFEFGGVPVPIFFHGEKHFLRLSVLPRGIKPGYVSILNMEGGRLPTPEPDLNIPVIAPPVVNKGNPFCPDINSYNLFGNEHPLELLTSLMPTAVAPLAGHSYAVEHVPNNSTTVSSPPPPSGAQTFGNINVCELFQKLVATGIVPPVGHKESTPAEDISAVKLVEFTKPETLKVKQPGLVSRLYTGIQCSSCGVRFSPEQTVKYSQHLDWHFRQNRRERITAKVAQSRRWNYDVSDWIQYQEIEDVDERVASWFEMQEMKKSSENEELVNEPSVLAGIDTKDAVCLVCHDSFEVFYNEEKEEWHFKNAIRVDNDLYHPTCYQEVLENRARVDPPDLTVLVDDEPIIIDDNDSNVLCDNLDNLDTKNVEETKLTTDDASRISISDNDVEIVTSGESEQIEAKEISSPSDPEVDNENGTATLHLPEHDSDDDILQIEVVERHIESFEILDDEDDENDVNKCNSLSTNISEPLKVHDIMSEDDEFIDFSTVKVKTEKIDVTRNDHVTVPSHVTVQSSIDGNVELDEATPVVLPKNKIKINISSKHMTIPRTTFESVSDVVMEPPPPGEELFPASLKPILVGHKMVIREPVQKGSESSGLCSIM